MISPSSHQDIISVGAKVVGLTSAGIFAGYTYALSRAAIPTILNHGLAPTHAEYEKTLLSQWRHPYVDGASLSRVCCITQALCFGYLAYLTPPASLTKLLYIIAGVTTASGVPWALTLLRRTNGALSIRARRLAGKYFAGGEEGEKNGECELRPMAITYASSEGRSIRRENGSEDSRWKDTRALVERWRWHNDLRTLVLTIGMMAGALAVVFDGQI